MKYFGLTLLVFTAQGLLVSRSPVYVDQDIIAALNNFSPNLACKLAQLESSFGRDEVEINIIVDQIDVDKFTANHLCYHSLSKLQTQPSTESRIMQSSRAFVGHLLAGTRILFLGLSKLKMLVNLDSALYFVYVTIEKAIEILGYEPLLAAFRCMQKVNLEKSPPNYGVNQQEDEMDEEALDLHGDEDANSQDTSKEDNLRDPVPEVDSGAGSESESDFASEFPQKKTSQTTKKAQIAAKTRKRQEKKERNRQFEFR